LCHGKTIQHDKTFQAPKNKYCQSKDDDENVEMLVLPVDTGNAKIIETTQGTNRKKWENG
jgi:hypothetical protein